MYMEILRDTTFQLRVGYILLLCACALGQSSKYWLRTPGTLYACAGEDVKFLWQYDPRMKDVEMIYWKFLNTGETLIGRHLKPIDKEVFYHVTYRDRVSLIQGEASAGLILKDVATRDAGRYRVELLPSGLSGSADLNIIKEDDLSMHIFVNNDVITSSAVLHKYGQQTVDIKVNTTSEIEGTIIISMADQPSKACLTARSCATTVILAPLNEDESNFRQMITVSVYFGACQPKEHIIYIQTAPGHDPDFPTTSDSGPEDEGTPASGDKKDALHKGIIAAIAISVFVFVCMCVALIIWIIFYRKKAKGYVLKPWQRKYVNLKIFAPLRGIRRKHRQRTSSRRRSEPHKVPLSLGEGQPNLNESMKNLSRVNRSLTKEDITIIYEPHEPKPDSLDGDRASRSYPESNEVYDGSFDKDDDGTEHSDSETDSGSDVSSAGSRDANITDPRVTSLQYSEMDDSKDSASKFV